MRLQLALNVPDLTQAIHFYEKLFATSVAKIEPGYANFEIAKPSLKLVLFESDSADRLNHLGVEVFSTEEVDQARSEWEARGLSVLEEEATECCFARQNKAVTYSPDGTMWETYHKLADVPHAPDQAMDLESPAPSQVAQAPRCC